MLHAYTAELAWPDGPLDADTIRVYASLIRQYLAWLTTADVDGVPLTGPAARDCTVRDYRTTCSPWLAASRPP